MIYLRMTLKTQENLNAGVTLEGDMGVVVSVDVDLNIIVDVGLRMKMKMDKISGMVVTEVVNMTIEPDVDTNVEDADQCVEVEMNTTMDLRVVVEMRLEEDKGMDIEGEGEMDVDIGINKVMVVAVDKKANNKIF